MEALKQERLSVGTGLESESKNSPKLIAPFKNKSTRSLHCPVGLKKHLQGDQGSNLVVKYTCSTYHSVTGMKLRKLKTCCQILLVK